LERYLILKKKLKLQKDRDDKATRIVTDPDYINAPSYGNSLKNILKVHPEGVPNSNIEKYLLLTADEIESIHSEACAKLRRYLQD
jgi:hypothetical protein